jgi:hypothetical protein
MLIASFALLFAVANVAIGEALSVSHRQLVATEPSNDLAFDGLLCNQYHYCKTILKRIELS